MQPILYSFRRCPYAIRARYTLAYSMIQWEHREILLRDKPQSMLDISPKGTVPVLELPEKKIIEESYEIMQWACKQNDPNNWYRSDYRGAIDRWVRANDEDFKPLLDGYKYPEGKERSQEEFRSSAEEWLSQLEGHLDKGFLLGEPTLADAALFPFIRQFRGVDSHWFDNTTCYERVKKWLHHHLHTPIFDTIMTKFPAWKPGDEPRFL